ncbi:MAG: 23S rRNA (guanosine(2251)-2'-O)-methyltransferase RlmB [Pseudomonadota bacterium]
MDDCEPYWLYGLHTVRAALDNPNRTVHRLLATRNAAARLDRPGHTPELVDVRMLSKLLGDAVHQGVAAYTDPLDHKTLETLRHGRAILCLDQITDPHNVGAVLRSAAAFNVAGVVTTRRNTAAETGVLAKAASGALDLVPIVPVTNMSRAVGELQALGFATAALDSAAEAPLEALPPADKFALILGAEGKGVRQGVRAKAGMTARIEAPGALASLNVSNAAAIALYVLNRTLLA